MKNDKPLQVKYADIDDLIPYINNARTHSDEQVTQICASIKEFGFTNPVLVDGDNGIIAGQRMYWCLAEWLEVTGMVTRHQSQLI